jgi:hypothetical protein
MILRAHRSQYEGDRERKEDTTLYTNRKILNKQKRMTGKSSDKEN